MAQFIPGQTTQVKATEPTLEVVIDATNPLKVGKYVFQLIVADDSGNMSDPANVTIVVLDRERPTAVITVINDQNERIPTPTVEIPFGRKFILTGDKSTDIGGTVKGYIWTLAS